MRTEESIIIELLTTADCAKVLGVSTGRVRQLVKAGRLKSLKAGRDHNFIKDDVESFIRNRLSRGRPKKT